jgi:hypothetical protein
MRRSVEVVESSGMLENTRGLPAAAEHLDLGPHKLEENQ